MEWNLLSESLTAIIGGLVDGRWLASSHTGFSEAGRRGAETMVIFRLWVLCLLATMAAWRLAFWWIVDCY